MPVVDEFDQIDATLPPELEGKSPQEIAQYYADFQERVMENARRIATQNRSSEPPPPPVPPRVIPVDDENKTATIGDLNRMAASAQKGLIAIARQTASEGKSDWAQLFPKIEAVMSNLTLDQQINADVWSECYYNVRGRMTDTLVDAARKSALGLEPVSPPPSAPPKPFVPSGEESRVIEGIGITPAMYADAAAKLDKGFHPFTTDNRRS